MPRFLLSIGLAIFILNVSASADQISVTNLTSDPIVTGEKFDLQGIFTALSSVPYSPTWNFWSTGGTYDGLIAPDTGEFVFNSPGDYTITYMVSYSIYGFEGYQTILAGYNTYIVGYVNGLPVYAQYPYYQNIPVYGFIPESLFGSETITVAAAPLPVSVPDGGATLGMLGLSLSGLIGIKKRFVTA